MKKLFLLMLLLCFFCTNNLFSQCRLPHISGDSIQTVCVNAPIDTIKYRHAGTTLSGERFCGLPNGVVGEIGNFNGTVKIYGTPTETGVFKFYITTAVATTCNTVILASGTITVNALPELTLTITDACNSISAAAVSVDSLITIKNPDFERFYKAGDTTRFTGFIPPTVTGPQGLSDTGMSGVFLYFCDNSGASRFDMIGWKWITDTNRVVFGNAVSYFPDGNTRQNHLQINGSYYRAYGKNEKEIYQVLDDSLTPGETHILTLSADFGMRNELPDISLPPMLRLYADNTLLAAIDSSTPPLVPGTFVTLSKTYQINNPVNYVHLKIGIGKEKEPVNVAGPQVLLDHVRLTKRSVNYDYLWNVTPSQTGASVDSLDNGSYNVLVTDHSPNHCVSSKNFTIQNPTPKISRQPDSLKAVCVGSSVSFSVIATGSELGYQWYRDGDPVNPEVNLSARTSTLVLNNVQQTDSGHYTVSISANNNCFITSQQALLTINPLPVANITGTTAVCLSSPTSIVFSASGGTVPYTFFYNIDNSNENSIVTTGVKDTVQLSIVRHEQGTFNYNLTAVKDSNGCMQPQNGTATITVIDKPGFTSAPTASVCDNSPFTYTATGSASGLSYRWKRRANNLITPPPAADSTYSDTILDTLHNTADQPVAVIYDFTLSNQTNCEDNFTVTVTVNPTPKTDSIADSVFCPGQTVIIPAFNSSSPNAVFRWTSDINIGFGTSGYGNIPSLPAINSTSATITANIVVSIKASGDSCAGPDRNFRINVLPRPLLTSPVTASVCDSLPFAYQALSASEGTTFTWTRNAQAGISNIAASGNNNVINELLDNTTNLPIIVPYIFNLKTGNGSGCSTSETVFVTVNPTPVTDVVPGKKYCNGDPVNGIRFTSSSPDSSFTWTSVPSIGFGASGSGDIPPFFAGNPGNTPITSTITISITASSDHCPGSNSSFAITVNPSPPKPDFNWLDLTTSLCSGSANINFNVISPDTTVTYVWRSPQMSATDVIIKDTNDANTAISFFSAGDKEITVQATSTGSFPFCNSTVTRIVKVNSTTGIDERKIFMKQPGNLLIYPDNSMDVGNGYQWGFDPIIKTEPDTVLGSPVSIQGQVYQFFTPDTNFTHNSNTLDVSHYAYWVLLKKGDCYSKVYYNGPFARRPMVVPSPTDNTIQLKVVPNPNNGFFDITLNGNIYGKMEAKIYNSTGQLIVAKSFVKTTAGLIEKLDADHLPAGLYYLILNSSDLKKAATRFIIQ